MSESDVVFVDFSWDSGPFGTYGLSDKRTPKIEKPGGYGNYTIPIPRQIWERYEAAESALHEAEDALNKAMEAFVSAASEGAL